MIKAFKAVEEEKVSDLAQLNMSQHKAIGNRGRKDVGDSGIRRGRKSFLERAPLLPKQNKIPLCSSSPLIAWIKGESRAGQEIRWGSLWGPTLQKGHLRLSERELENLVPVVQA